MCHLSFFGLASGQYAGTATCMHIIICLGIEQKYIVGLLTGTWYKLSLGIPAALLEGRFARLCDTYVTIVANTSGRRNNLLFFFFFVNELIFLPFCSSGRSLSINVGAPVWWEEVTMGKVSPYTLKIFDMVLIRTDNSFKTGEKARLRFIRKCCCQTLPRNNKKSVSKAKQ